MRRVPGELGQRWQIVLGALHMPPLELDLPLEHTLRCAFLFTDAITPLALSGRAVG